MKALVGWWYLVIKCRPHLSTTHPKFPDTASMRLYEIRMWQNNDGLGLRIFQCKCHSATILLLDALTIAVIDSPSCPLIYEQNYNFVPEPSLASARETTGVREIACITKRILPASLVM